MENQKVNHSAVPYPKTGQFRNAIQNVKAKYTFKGLDEQNKAIYDPSVLLPVVPYIATVKVHGTNASLVMFKDQTIYCQSKERTLAFGCDNAGFWEAMQGVDKENLFRHAKLIFSHHNPEKEILYPIVIAGEWLGCFSYNTPILLADGSTLPIGKIVNSKMEVEVLSFNQDTLKIEPKKIIGWYNNGSTDDWLRIYYKRRKRGGQACAITVTPNHKIFSKKDNLMVEVCAGDLQEGDIVYIKGNTLPHKSYQFILGTLLGDGYILDKKHLVVSHTKKQASYIQLLQKLVTGKVTSKTSGFGSDLLCFNSVSLPEIEDLYDELYTTTGNTKEPTLQYLNKMGPIALAAWYMDDGSLIDQSDNGRQPSCDLHIQGFSPSTVEIVVKFLCGRGYECYSFLSRIKSNGEEGKDIRFTPKGANAFLEDIAPYILSQFSYKLPKYLRNIPKIDISEVYSEYEQPLLETVITKIDNTFKPNVKTKYDIQVEGNHNYFSNNMLVHNSGIQKGVAVSELPKTFMIFGVKFGEEWQPMLQYKNLSDHKSNIYNALDFDHWFLDIDFNNPQDIQNKIIKLTHQVEAECPVGKHFGVSGIGEGIVLKPLDGELSSNSGYFFKSKGEKHSSSKVKKLASVDTEKLNSIREFVEYSVTESRLEQAVTEVGLDVKLMGSFIKWIMQDIFKEESDTMRDNGIEMKEIGKPVSDIARRFYLNKINSQF